MAGSGSSVSVPARRSLSGFSSEDAAYRNALLKLATAIRVPILFGAPALTVRDGQYGFFNRADLVSAQGELVAHYDKINLVPFGEYVPAHRFLGYFVNRVVEGFGDMIPGTATAPRPTRLWRWRRCARSRPRPQ